LQSALSNPTTGEALKNNLIAGYNYYDDNNFDAYLLFNAELGYKFNNFLGARTLRTFLKINNVMNNLYAAGAEGKNFFPAAERNFYLSIEYGF
jgi:outer membrane receptor for ferric coprogen and ferric-rhodotorulic acid